MKGCSHSHKQPSDGLHRDPAMIKMLSMLAVFSMLVSHRDTPTASVTAVFVAQVLVCLTLDGLFGPSSFSLNVRFRPLFTFLHIKANKVCMSAMKGPVLVQECVCEGMTPSQYNCFLSYAN